MSAAAAPLPPSIPSSGSLYAAGSSGDGGDDPSRRRIPLDPSHGLDANPVLPGEEEEEEKEEKLEQEGVEAVPGAKHAEAVAPPSRIRRRWGVPFPEGPQQCATCFKVFPSIMSLHGHMRCHPVRLRRWGAGMVAKDQGADRKRLFICDRCGQVFHTRQSLGGHRASHRGQQGCYEMAKEEREYGQPSSGKARSKKAIRSGEAAADAALSDANSVLSSLFTERARPPTTTAAAAAAAPRPPPAPPTATGSSTETRQGRRRRRRKKRKRNLSIDLNLIPVNINLPPEISSSEEMDETGNIGGNRSSSSTS